MTDGVARRAGAGALRGGLRLLAHEPDDVEIFSALLQDAAARPEDARWLKAERRFLLPLQRFRWEAEGRDERVSAALAVEKGWRPSEIMLERDSLDTVFAQLSGKGVASLHTGAHTDAAASRS